MKQFFTLLATMIAIDILVNAAANTTRTVRNARVDDDPLDVYNKILAGKYVMVSNVYRKVK